MPDSPNTTDSPDSTVYSPGEEAKKVFDDAQRMLKKIVKDKSLKANAVIAFYKANSVGDDIEVYNEDGVLIDTLHGIRQQVNVFVLGAEGEAWG